MWLLRARRHTRIESWVRVELAEIDGLEIHDRAIGERLVS